MQYRTFGDTGLEASAVGFGVWTVSTRMWGITDEEIRQHLLRRAFELGITLYDTADVYGDGRGETILRDVFAGKRDQIVIVTKFGYDWYTAPGEQPDQRERPQDWSPAFVKRACEESLKRLGTDYIDVYQMHNPRVNDIVGHDDLFAALEELKAEGKIRHIGASLGPAINERQSEEGVACFRARKMSAITIIYNLLEQQLGAPIFEAARETGGGLMVRVPHASGLLEGQYTEDTQFAPGDHRNWRVTTNEKRKLWLEDGLKKVARLDFLTENGRTLGQAALQFIWREKAIACALPNIYDEKQLEELAAAADTPPLTDEEFDAVQRLYADNFGLELAAVA